MNYTTLNKELVLDVIGTEWEYFMNMTQCHRFLIKYIIPFVSVAIVVTNLSVAILCIIIYLQIKRQNHRPAFVFIGFLALMDFFLGGYVMSVM